MFFGLTVALMLAAADVDTLTAANQAYDNYDFAQAAQLYERALKTSTITDKAARSNARVKWAFSLFISENKKGAADALRPLFSEDPSYQLDRKGVHPDLLKFYDGEREKAPAPKPVPPPPEVVTRPAKKYEPAHIALRLLPLGIGHFANGDPVAGGLFLGAEVALVATNIATALTVGKSCDRNMRNCTQQDKEMALYVTQNVSAGLIIAVAIVDVIDAIVWSPKRAEERFMKMALAPTPNGATLVLSKAF